MLRPSALLLAATGIATWAWAKYLPSGPRSGEWEVTASIEGVRTQGLASEEVAAIRDRLAEESHPSLSPRTRRLCLSGKELARSAEAPLMGFAEEQCERNGQIKGKFETIRRCERASGGAMTVVTRGEQELERISAVADVVAKDSMGGRPVEVSFTMRLEGRRIGDCPNSASLSN